MSTEHQTENKKVGKFYKRSKENLAKTEQLSCELYGHRTLTED